MPEVMSIEVDEEFDPRPPSRPFSFRDPEGNWNFGMIAGVVVAIILILALIVVVAKPFGAEEAPPVASKWTPKDPTEDAEFLETYPATSAQVTSLQTALEDWATYYTTAKLNDLSTSFDLAGPQYAQLVQQQPTIAADPEDGEPSIIQLGPVGKVTRKNDIYTTRTVVTWTKPGSSDPKEYNWDIDLKADDNRFLLYTVRETDPEALKPLDFCGAVNLIAQVDDDDKIFKETSTMTPDKQFELTLEAMAIRLKVWELLESAVAGTDSESDVTPIVNHYNALMEAGERSETIEEWADAQQEPTISQNQEAIVERASTECDGADISNR